MSQCTFLKIEEIIQNSFHFKIFIIRNKNNKLKDLISKLMNLNNPRKLVGFKS
jgi:hypothetical protein